MVSMPDSFFFKSQKIKPMLDETLLKKGLARLILFVFASLACYDVNRKKISKCNFSNFLSRKLSFADLL